MEAPSNDAAVNFNAEIAPLQLEKYADVIVYSKFNLNILIVFDLLTYYSVLYTGITSNLQD